MELSGQPDSAITEGWDAEPPSWPMKMIVWDLDDTFWDGTLSEGPVVLDQARIDLVRTLNRRGIVNSICSKNHEVDVRSRLVDAGIWDEFVFSSIDWSPKGPRVAQIVDGAQLRPPDVLFIDDLPLNRAEVRHAVPGIRTAAPEVIDELLALPEFTGKDDRDLSRLRQYKVLEQKFVDRGAAPTTGDEFLRSCDIRIGVFADAAAEADRLFELVLRTNQLNFTKRRPSREEFEATLADPGQRCGYVRVRDRYGDYGICGFFSLSLGDRTLTDFLFSCRVLNMGVEQWLLDFLGRPSIAIVGEVASTLEGTVDWITLDDGVAGADAVGGDDVVAPSPAQPRRVLMIGGCDLTTMARYLGGEIATHLSHTGPTGAFIYVGHTENLRQSSVGVTAEQEAIIDRIPFLDREVFASPAVVAPDYDVLVYSLLTDFTQALYRHRATGLVVPWHQFDVDATDARHWPGLERRYGREGIDQEFLRWFADEFEFEGGMTPDGLQENIRWLAGSIPDGARLVLLNGAEVEIQDSLEPGRHLRHREMNAALDSVVPTLPNATICDVRTIVRTEEDLLTDIRHYRRYVYLRLAEAIRADGLADLAFQPPGAATRAYRQVHGFAGRRKVEVRRLYRRMRGLPTYGPARATLRARRARSTTTRPRPE